MPVPDVAGFPARITTFNGAFGHCLPPTGAGPDEPRSWTLESDTLKPLLTLVLSTPSNALIGRITKDWRGASATV